MLGRGVTAGYPGQPEEPTAGLGSPVPVGSPQLAPSGPGEGTEGHFQPPPDCEVFTAPLPPGQNPLFVHCSVMALAGAVSDELADRTNTGWSGEKWVRDSLVLLFPGDDPKVRFGALTAETREFLERPKVRGMVAALVAALLEHTTLVGDDAILVMESAL